MRLFRVLAKWFSSPHYTLFISYSREHEKVALNAYNFFKAYHLPFLDQINIESGKPWDEKIVQTLRRCTHLLVIWCVHADKSDYVNKEIDLALRNGEKTILIMIIGDHPLPEKLALYQTLPLMFEKVCLGDAPNQKAAEKDLPDSPKAFFLARGMIESQHKSDVRSVSKRRLAAMSVVTFLLVPYSFYLTKPADISLSVEAAMALRAGQVFKECATGCPQMVVAPTGVFTMGSPDSEPGRRSNEGPQHEVGIARKFAAGRFAVTFDEWDLCVADGDCPYAKDEGWGRGRRPVINVSWDDAKIFTAWLSRRTGRDYRLLSEAEREYVMRSETRTSFWTGESISTLQANYDGRISGGEFRAQTVPVDTFPPNPWGFYQTSGNVWEWTEDCYHSSYEGAPSDGSAWISGDCSVRVARGGSWVSPSDRLRSAARERAFERADYVGFRVARTLTR
jgi:formylglycine-generating enzyme required for sulfatase activity